MLREKLDEISNDFSSTFSYVGPTKLANLLVPEDFPEVERILKNHLGEGVEVKFRSTGQLVGPEGRDIYVIELCGLQG